MVKGSLDIEYIPRREEREYTAKSQSYYTQTKQFDEKGNLEKEIWEREDSLGNFIILDDAVYTSKEKLKGIETGLKSKKFSSSELMKSAKKEEYMGKDGVIIFLSQGKLYYSSNIIEIEPPFGEEYKDITGA